MSGMRGQRGYTLIEVLVAFLVITFVITLSFAAFLERTKRLQQANEIVLAYQALANEAEYRRRMDYATLETEPAEFVSDLALLAPLAPFETAASVQQTAAGTKNVTLSIRWRNGEREAKLGLIRVDTGGTNLW